ncbi:MAG: fumarylacetoacetate hydrolase family protein [Bacteroidetes bacterium]|nr:fumarylacetoacetate hydrolase family protein [Bacteroidota bacterium]
MKIICIGRNYRLHALELGNEIPEKPVIFCKPDTAILKNNAPFYIPSFTNDIHHEIEVVIRINKVGKTIQPQFAHKYYSEFTLGVDFTARTLQNELKIKGLPWELAKAFDHSAVVGNFMKKENFNLNVLDFKLLKNNEIVQTGNTNDMLFKIDEIIAFVSQYFTLKIGDLIFTGTPAGVGPVAIGDKLIGKLADVEMFNFEVK